jgi:predicted S18 family serine protease
MAPTTSSLLLFTAANLGDRSLFRTVQIDITMTAGAGRLFLDVSRNNGFQLGWQQHLQRLQDRGRDLYDLPWDSVDLHISPRGRGLVLDGASASLPVFVAWVALLAGKPLPDPFFATGVATPGTDALAAAPRGYIQGKLSMAADIVAARYQAMTPVEMWIPEGSDVDRTSIVGLSVREVPTLREAVREIVRVEARS